MNAPSALILSANTQGIEKAASLLSSGRVVAFPTETVYGLGADARNGAAVARVFEIKGRPSFNPLIVHMASAEAARHFVHWSDEAEKLAAAFWPGPLSLVLPLKPDHGLSPLVTAGLPTVALRVPQHPTAQSLLDAFGGPVAAPSANPSGRISPTTARHVVEGLGNKIAAVLDAGACSVGLESTIVGFAPEPTLLRAGGVSVEGIEAILGTRLQTARDGEINAPGQLLSHYAPDAPLRLNVVAPEKHEFYLGFGAVNSDLNLSAAADLTEAAANLFDFLHRANASGKPIAVAPVPLEGLGLAINDRLRRAAAPRKTQETPR